MKHAVYFQVGENDRRVTTFTGFHFFGFPPLDHKLGAGAITASIFSTADATGKESGRVKTTSHNPKRERGTSGIAPRLRVGLG